MTKEEREQKNLQLIAKLQKGEEEYYNDLLEVNEPLILAIIKRYFANAVKLIGLDSLIQDGRIGMLNAAKRYLFDASIQTKLSTYLANGVYYNLLNSVNLYKRENALKSISLYTPCSLRTNRTTEDKFVLDKIADTSQNVEEDILTAYDRQNEVSGYLKVVEQNVKPLRFKIFKAYFLSEESRSYEDIAAEFSMTKQAVSVNIKKCLNVIRNSLDETVAQEDIKKPRNIILENLDNPEMMAKIKDIVQTRLLENQREVILRRYFSEGGIPSFVQVAIEMGTENNNVCQTETQALEKIKKEYERIYHAKDPMRDIALDPDKMKYMRHYLRFKCTPLQQQMFDYIYLTEENSGLTYAEIAKKYGQDNSDFKYARKKFLEALKGLDDRYDLTDIPDKVKRFMGVQEIDLQVFVESFWLLEDAERASVYSNYFICSTVCSKNNKSMEKLKEIYFELLKEKQQEEEVV